MRGQIYTDFTFGRFEYHFWKESDTMNMDEIVEKRSQLLNYFFNKDVKYSKIDILNKEYSALNFSPREEFIDIFTTNYEDILTPFTELDDNHDEVFLKGIIVDVDNKKGFSIIHIQNKSDNVSVSIDESVLYHYGKYLEKGHIVLIKGHTYNGKVYMHFLIDYNSDDSFLKERNYLDGVSKQMIDDLDYTHRHDLVGLVCQSKYFKSKKGNNCLRLQVYERGKEKTYITCSNLPKNIVAGMFVSYNESNNSAFCNNLQEIQI